MNDTKMKSLRRRAAFSTGADVIRAGAIEMDPERLRLWVGNRLLDLAWKDFELLRALLEARGEVVRREFLMGKIWGIENPSERASRIVDVHIVKLRQKLGPEGRRILTVRNVGYRFDICLEWITFGI